MTTTEILKQLVACPSVNPGKNTPDGIQTGEAKMVELLEALLKPVASHVEIQKVLPGRPNLIARFDGLNPERSLAFEAHTDTVSVADMTIDPFKPTVRGGKLYGRGSCDTKGPMAAMLSAIFQYIKRHGPPPVTWYFLATCDEELGAAGAKALMKSGFRCDGIFVGEPTQRQFITRHKGARRFHIRVHGKGGHSAYPEYGVNAIHAAADYIRQIEKYFASDKVPSDPVLGKSTFSTGCLNGGHQVNLIPDLAEADLDFRTLGRKDEEELNDVLSNLWKYVRARRPGSSCECIPAQHYPPLECNETAPFIQWLRKLDLSRLANPEFGAVRYATNAGIYSQANIPCVVFGPGSIEQAHTCDEWIALDELEQATRFLLHCIEESARFEL